MRDLTHLPTRFRCKQSMYMVRHHNPGMQVIPYAIEMQQRVLHLGGDFLVFHEATAVTSIEICVYPFAALNIVFLLGQVRGFITPLLKHILRHRIIKTKGHSLRDLASIKMWNVPARMPACGAESAR